MVVYHDARITSWLRPKALAAAAGKGADVRK